MSKSDAPDIRLLSSTVAITVTSPQQLPAEEPFLPLVHNTEVTVSIETHHHASVALNAAAYAADRALRAICQDHPATLGEQPTQTND